jgi:pyruvate,orthophosphate dikinase
MVVKSKALEVNLSGTRADVTIDEKYQLLLDIFDGYVGILNRLEIFLKELSHPYWNWGFIVSEARHFTLHYFYLYKPHPEGRKALELFADIFITAFESRPEQDVRAAAVDNLMLVLHHIAKESGQEVARFLPVMEKEMNRIHSYEGEAFHLFVCSYYQPDRLAQVLVETLGKNKALDIETGLFLALNRLLVKFYDASFTYWLTQDDPVEWMRENIDEWRLNDGLIQSLDAISHSQLIRWQDSLKELVLTHDMASCDTTAKLILLIGYRDFVKRFKEVPRQIIDHSQGKTYGKYFKLTFLFYIIHSPGLAGIHREALGDIHRTLIQLIGDRGFKKDIRIVDQTFSLLKEHKGRYPGTVLECIHKIGDAVYETGEIELINHFIDRAVDHGFQFPMIRGTGEDWQIQGNNAHVKNIRVFLSLVGRKPKKSKRLLSALIVSLSIGGVFIRDTDLFPRDITQFLNSDVGPVFNLVKQLARLLPTFFNEIGAEGELRDISTQLDEVCNRRDRLVHFLRKQCHVESSSRIVEFIEQVILFWKTRDKTPLEPFVPPSIYGEISPTGRFVDGPGTILLSLESKGLALPEDYLVCKQETLDRLVDKVEGVKKLDRSRVKLMFRFYRLLNEKYGIRNLDLKDYLAGFRTEDLPDPQRLILALEEQNLETRIELLLNYMLQLKEIILSDKTYAVNEAIYHKRHFAVDIPSMYGSYNEAKFDALGLTLRIESIVNVLFEDLINGIDLRLITKPIFVKIFSILMLFRKALSLDGIVSNKLDTQLEFLKYSVNITTCSYTQYLDIFKGFIRAVADAVSDNFNTIHSGNLVHMESRIGKNQILKKYLPGAYAHNGADLDAKMAEKLDQRMADIFFRDRIATSLGLQQLDVFLNRILHTLFRQSEKLSQDELSALLNYDPKCSVTYIDDEDPISNNIIYLGNKGLNLIKLKHLGIEIPNGFIITTEVFKCLDLINGYTPAAVNFKQHVTAMLARLEEKSHASFGDPANPLLLSVRSGSSISQPGMLDSFLNVGINEEIAASIAEKTGNPWFAWDSYRRFLQAYGMTFDIQRDAFDHIIGGFKERHKISFKRYFTGVQMREVALAYKQLLVDSGVELIESPMEQLFLGIHKVFSSWNSKRAKDYRQIMGISDDWGTAVTVQAMVFGNRSRQSGSGVVFSHSPKLPGDTIRLWGDFTIGNQGEDVVSGLVKTLPISEIQKDLEERESKISLETKFPQIYKQLVSIVQQLIYDGGWNPQEIEFTFEGPEKKDLFILQARDLSLRDRKKMTGFEADDMELAASYLGQGIGVSGGAMSGRIVFTLEEIDGFRRQDPDANVILVRNDTVPDDILEIDSADGILTAKGGLTSHAAVVAYNLRKTCVVGCENLVCNEREKECTLDGVKMKVGDYISINGYKGSVYQGEIKVSLI